MYTKQCDDAIDSIQVLHKQQRMKKFILKGKELLSKKLEQFDIDPVDIDYVGDQTPSRLKQPLNVLRNNEIDLEDNHEYETYFKNYPNHHISHYLLDKFKSSTVIKSKKSVQQNSEPNYIPPANPNSYIPQFNHTLQTQALYFKQSVQQYEQVYSKSQRPLVCICITHFHHKRGAEIEYIYPDDKSIDNLSEHIVHHAMPDSSHLRNQDSSCFGKKRMLFGVSSFKQIAVTDSMKKANNELTRSHVQKSITIISTLPLFEYLKQHLQATTQHFFEQLTNFALIKQAYMRINQNLKEQWPNIQLPDLYMGCDINKIVDVFGISNLYDIWKAILYEKRVVVFAQTSSDASSFILSLLSLFPGLSAFGICSKPISRYLQSLREYSLPLRIFSSKNFLAISFHVQDFWKLSKFTKNEEGSYLLGTTNKLLKQANEYGIQMLINLTQGTVIKNKGRRAWQQPTKKQKTFISDLKQTLDSIDISRTQVIEDTIRGCFHQFLKSALVQMILGIREYQDFVTECEKYEKSLKLDKNPGKQLKKEGSYDLMQDQQDISNSSNQPILYAPTFPTSTSQIILPELLLNKSFAYFRQFHNQHLPQILNEKQLPSIQIKNYLYILRKQTEQFISYNWLDKKLSFGKGKLNNFDGKQIKFQVNSNLEIVKIGKLDVAASVYVGMVEAGRYARHGFYVDQSEYYEGEFQDGFKHGYGKYNNLSEKYIGNFEYNLYQGQGQLVKNGTVYVGSFRQGLKHGLGNLQGSSTLIGQWIDDKYIVQNQKIQAKKQKSVGKKEVRKGSQQQEA